MDLAAHKEALKAFARSHLTGDATNDHFINLKLEHSLHVHQNALQIVKGEGFSDRNARVCHLASLYHDIGRFPQFARFGTFNDRESINHGRMGVLTTREQQLFTDMSPEDMRLVRIAIGQHNLKTIRDDIPEPYATPVKLVRDADKVDIFRIMVAHFSGENPDPVVTHGYEDIPGKYTPEIFQSVMNDEPGDYSLIQYANDFKLVLIGWLKDLNYRTSLDIINERQDVARLFSFLPDDDNIKSLEEKTKVFIRYNYNTPS